MKLLDNNSIKILLNRFPKSNIKNLNIFSNINKNLLNNNNNVSYYILKPKGKKSYIWFTYLNNEIFAILIIINNNNINDISNQFYKLNINFDKRLCYNNVLLYGYYFKDFIKNSNSNNSNSNNSNISNSNNSNIILNYFIIENVFNYNIYKYLIESNNYNYYYKNKLELFSKILPYINNSNNFCIKLPIILENIDNLYKTIYNLNYNIFSISGYSETRYLGSYILNNNNNNNNNKLVATFKITPNISNDIYNLFILSNNNELFYDLALIDTYKTSVYMNNLFRNIKENKNLDYLEESDEEEDFENIEVNKYVYLEKTYNIECIYSYKFKKWIPQKISKNNIINKNNLELILNKKKIFL